MHDITLYRVAKTHRTPHLIFRKSDLYFVTLLWKMICNLRDPMSLRDPVCICTVSDNVERWGAGVETQKNVRGEIGGWGRVPFNEPYAPSLSTIYDGA